MSVDRYGLYEDPTTHTFAMNPQDGGPWVRWEDFVETGRLVEAWKFDAGRQTGFLRKAERDRQELRDALLIACVELSGCGYREDGILAEFTALLKRTGE